MAPRRSVLRMCRRQTNAPLDRAWQAMRILRTFSTPDILATAECNRSSFTRYLKGLEATGYVRVTRQYKARWHVPKAWFLVRDSGPLRPHLQSDGIVWDRNLGVEFHPREVRHDH